MNNKATRPGVQCACSNNVVFAKERKGDRDGVICPLCFRYLWRPEANKPIQYKDKLGKLHNLQDINVIVG